MVCLMPSGLTTHPRYQQLLAEPRTEFLLVRTVVSNTEQGPAEHNIHLTQGDTVLMFSTFTTQFPENILL